MNSITVRALLLLAAAAFAASFVAGWKWGG